MQKVYFIPDDKILPLVSQRGSGIASDKIMVNGEPVGFMYRETPFFETDSGWRFFSGTEDQEYVDNADNLQIYELNTIVNYDFCVIEFPDYPVGSEFEKNLNNQFVLIA